MASRYEIDSEEYYESMARKHSRTGRLLEIPEITYDDDSDDDNFTIVQSRRGSVISLSRFRSCPDLTQVETEPNPEQDVDDGNVMKVTEQSSSKLSAAIPTSAPLMGRRLYVDKNEDIISETPTPPSTPKSLRSFLSHRSRPSSRLLHREQFYESSLSRTSSIDSGGIPDDISLPLSEQNMHIFEKACILPHQFVKYSKSLEQDTDSPIKYCFDSEGYRRQNESTDSDDAQGKCERWLKSLKICKPDRMKSQSHIQLPPI